jgi:hypothetical protein
MARIPPRVEPQIGEGKKRIRIPKVETDSKGVHWVLIGKKRIRLKGKMSERELIKFIITKLVRRRKARKASAPKKTGLKGTAEWKDPNPAFSKVGVDDQAVASYYNALRKQIEAPKPADSQHVTKEDVRQLLEDKRLKLLYQPSEDYLSLENIPRSAQSMPPLDRYEHKRTPGTAIRVKPEKFETPKRASSLKSSRPPSSQPSSSKPGSSAGSAAPAPTTASHIVKKSLVTKKPSPRKTRSTVEEQVSKRLADDIGGGKLRASAIAVFKNFLLNSKPRKLWNELLRSHLKNWSSFCLTTTMPLFQNAIKSPRNRYSKKTREARVLRTRMASPLKRLTNLWLAILIT